MHDCDAVITALAADQHGLITRRQLLEIGVEPDLARRRREAGHWRTVAPGVFVVGGAPRTFRQRVLAEQLAAGDDSLVSHRTAVSLWGVPTGVSIPIEVSVPRGRSLRRRGVITHISRDLDRASACTIDGIPVTGLSRSLLDLGAVEPSVVRRAVWAARRTHDLSWDELLDTLVGHARRGRDGVGPLRRVLASHYGEVAADSGTEDLAYGLLFDSALVPGPVKQVPATCADGVVVTADLGWPQLRCLIEIYGVDHFTNEDVQQIDLHRRNQLELAGYGVLTYSGRHLRDRPDQFVADTRKLLLDHGWKP